MPANRHKLITHTLVWLSLLGLVLSMGAKRPPCSCSLPPTQSQAVVCPHCADANSTTCCEGGQCDTGDCECPCCQGTPADQPLISVVVESSEDSDLQTLLVLVADYDCENSITLEPATGGWLDGQLATKRTPNLNVLCRWII